MKNKITNIWYGLKGSKPCKYKHRKAFTLIELIVVMAIIAVLVLLGSPKYQEHSKEAELTRLKVNVKEIESASSQYYMRYNNWPRLSEIPYNSEELQNYAERIYDKTGSEVELEDGNYYDIDYTKINNYIKVPEDKENYILRNPVGSVYYLKNLTEEGLEFIGKGPLPPREPTKLPMNNGGSTVVNEQDRIVVGDELEFNYTNNSNLTWVVSQSGLYRVEVLGAGAGGKGAKVEGEIELVQGDVMNFKIHSQSNGGGSGVAGPDSHGSGKAGSGGTLVKINNEIIIASGGAGGSGGNGYYPNAYRGPVSVLGGIGGDGGLIGESGNKGQSRNVSFQIRTLGVKGKDGGVNPSEGGSDNGRNGMTLFDGGGGASGPSGGGGAGGNSFVDESKVTNSVVTAGFNSGNGKVILELIEKHR